MSQQSTWHDAQRAGIRDRPQVVFMLWAIQTNFCTQVEDFAQHFGRRLPLMGLMQDRERGGFVWRRGKNIDFHR